MAENEKDYSDYVTHLSSIWNGLCILAGFSFTAITVLLTLLPDPSILLAQVTLFLLFFLICLLYFLINWNGMESIYHCRNLPKPKRSARVFNLLVILSNTLFGIIVLFMFLMCNLICLTLASAVVQALLLILGYIFNWKPYLEYRKKLSSQK